MLSEVEACARELFDLFGYRRIDTPIFEHTETFMRAVGDSSDVVVNKQMYTFSDAKGRSLTLRPEGTASVVRAYVEHDLGNKLPAPVRLYYMGPMFRYERPQAGRSRQFLQFGPEVIGSDSPVVDAEVIAWGAQFYAKIGLDPVILLNSMGCAQDRLKYGELLKQVLADRTDGLCEDCETRLATNPLRVFDCKVESCREILRSDDIQPIVETICPECREHFDAVQRILESLGVAWKNDPHLVRGFDYYTRTVFEYDMASLGARTAIGGGGRYDGLVQEFGGQPTPAIGMAVGVEPTLLAMSKLREPTGWRPDVFVIWLEDSIADLAMATCMDLRKAGFSATLSDKPRSMRAQMRAADRAEARHTVILGPQEIERGVATVKNLTTGDQSEVALTDIVKTISEA